MFNLKLDLQQKLSNHDHQNVNMLKKFSKNLTVKIVDTKIKQQIAMNQQVNTGFVHAQFLGNS